MEYQLINPKPIKKFSRFVSKKFWLKFLLVLVGVLIVFGVNSSVSPGVFTSLFRENPLVDEAGRINVLLLGTPGAGHDGPNLTDTIMVASYNTKTNQLTLISLPRDLWIDKHQAKVNALYQIGLNKGQGLDFVEEEIGQILGLKIPFGLRIDFSGFVKAVDQIGGIKVNVENAFDDFAYPIPGKEKELCGNTDTDKDLSDDEAKALGLSKGLHHVLINPEGKIATASADNQKEITYSDSDVLKYFPCRFEHLHFDQGERVLDGETALKFVRSRHGTGKEGSDFARSKRQQIAIEAFKEKALSLGTLTDPAKITGLISAFGNSVEVDFPATHYLEMITLAKKINGTHSYVIDGAGQEQILIHPNEGYYGGAWVLIPPKNDFTVVSKYVANLLAKDATASATKK